MSDFTAIQERTEARITELEIKLSYTEDLLDTLNALVARQQQDISTLLREVVNPTAPIRPIQTDALTGWPQRTRSWERSTAVEPPCARRYPGQRPAKRLPVPRLLYPAPPAQ